jgi:large exoprotein involved in heme utilization and adhesion
MTLQNSQILAQAVQGQGGNINITAGTFLADQTSLVSASSEFGLSGTVNIQSPVSSLSGTLATLPQRPLQTQNLLTQRCAAQTRGQLSSLVMAERDAMPAEPGGWLMSPLAFAYDEDAGQQAYRGTTDSIESSLPQQALARRLPDRVGSPPQLDATNWAAGCGS